MRRNWFRRLLLSYLPVLILIVCLFIFIGIVQLNELSRKEAVKSSRIYVQSVQNSIDMTLRSIESMMLETIARNMKLTSFASMKSDPLFIIELSQLLQSMTTTNSWIESAYLYRAEDGTVLSDKTKLQLEQFADQPYIESQINRPGEDGWSPPRSYRILKEGNSEGTVISISRGIPLQSKGIAILVVTVKLSAIREFLDKYGNSDIHRLVVTDSRGQLLFGPSSAESQGSDVSLFSDYTGWTYSGSLKKAGPGNLYFYLSNGWFLLGLLGVSVGIGWVIYITRRNYRPIETILSRIQKYNQVHKENPIREPSIDELAYIDYTLECIIEVSAEYQNQNKENRKYRRLLRFQELVEGSRPLDAAEWEAELRELGMETFGSAAVSVIEIDKYIEFIRHYSRQDQGLLKYIVRKVVEETADSHGLRIWQEWVTNHRLCVLFLEEDKRRHAEAQILSLLEQVRQWMQEHVKLTVTIGLGGSVTEGHAISESYEAAIRAMDYKSALGSNRVIGHWEIELLSRDDLYIYLQYVPTIAQAFWVGNAGWQEQLRLLFDGLRRLLLPKEEIAGILNYMNYYFYREMMELPPDYQELWNREFRTHWEEKLEALETLDELEHFYSSRLTACADMIEDVRRSKGNHGTVQMIKEYIEANFSNPDLSQAGLSEQFQINSSSLSTLFKEDFGEKFVVYLCRIRMEHAKELLRTTTLSVQDISEKVGYLHQMSFIREFKKTVGTTPGDYRKVHQAGR
jgi:AraC-like DNA-binding protein